MVITTHRSTAVARPILRRTRSWRGLMQVRYDVDKINRRELLSCLFLRVPLVAIAKVLCALSIMYFGLGHDRFVHMLYGYESEMMYEGRVNPTMSPNTLHSMVTLRSSPTTPLRALEQPLHPMRSFDLFTSK